MIERHHFLVASWAQLDRALCDGRPVRKSAAYGDDDRQENFLMGMFNNTTEIAPGFARAVDLAGRRKTLDLGGGPGTYAIHFCKQNHCFECASTWA